MITMWEGKKTYIVGIGGLVYAALGFFNGWLDGVQAMQIVQVSLAAMGLRAAIK